MTRTVTGTLVAIIVGIVAGLVLGAILGAILEIVLYFIVTLILNWLAGVIGSWIFGALAGLYVGGIIGGVVGALIGLLLHPRRWFTASHTAFYGVLGLAAAWIAFTRYGLILGTTLVIIDGALLGAVAGLIARIIAGALAGSTTRVGIIMSAIGTRWARRFSARTSSGTHCLDQRRRWTRDRAPHRNPLRVQRCGTQAVGKVRDAFGRVDMRPICILLAGPSELVLSRPSRYYRAKA